MSVVRGSHSPRLLSSDVQTFHRFLGSCRFGMESHHQSTAPQTQVEHLVPDLAVLGIPEEAGKEVDRVHHQMQREGHPQKLAVVHRARGSLAVQLLESH